MDSNSKVRALMIGAHPDDCEYWTGGIAAKFRALGHAVKYVSVTNGNAGHHLMDPTALARRRYDETRAVADLADIEYRVYDVPDGKLVPDLVTRDLVITEIREYQPDLIFTLRPNDYHPDHRAMGTLVMDASYLIRVPSICPTIPALTKTPIILYMPDRFNKPVPFQPDVVVGIDEVLDTKARMLDCHRSQFYEWLPYVGGYADDVPTGENERLSWLRGITEARDAVMADKYRNLLVDRYGETVGASVRCIEAFEVCEYGRPLPSAEIDRWFPR